MKQQIANASALSGWMTGAIRLVVACATLGLALLPGQVVATSLPGETPEFTIEVWAENFMPVREANRTGTQTYYFQAKLDVPVGGPIIAADVYFGMSTPGQHAVFTWSESAGGPALASGMTPALRVENLHVPGTIQMAEVLGEHPSYQFNGQEKTGMYLVFALLVTAGADPADPSNWLAVRMEPLFVR